MYICVCIGSEYYTDLCCVFCNTVEEARAVIAYINSDYETLEWNNEPEIESDSFIARCFSHNGDEEDYGDYWCVDEIHKVDKKYNVVYWHAYNGVGFDVHSFDTYEEASEYLAKNAKEFADQIREEDLVSCDIDDSSAVIDDNYEWHMWKIIKTPEGK